MSLHSRKLRFLNQWDESIYVVVRSDEVQMREVEESGKTFNWGVNVDSTVSPTSTIVLPVKIGGKGAGSNLAYSKNNRTSTTLEWKKYSPTGEFRVPANGDVSFTLDSEARFGTTAYFTVKRDKDQLVLCKDYPVRADIVYFRNGCLYEFGDVINYGDIVCLYNFVTRRYLSCTNDDNFTKATLADAPVKLRFVPTDDIPTDEDEKRPLLQSDTVKVTLCKPIGGSSVMASYRWSRKYKIGFRRIRFTKDSPELPTSPTRLWFLGKSDRLPASGCQEVREGDAISLRNMLNSNSYLRGNKDTSVFYDHALTSKRWWVIRKCRDYVGQSKAATAAAGTEVPGGPASINPQSDPKGPLLVLGSKS